VQPYVPDRGDIVWLSFNPQAGHEQSDRGPALTILPRVYNQKAGLGLFCPLTSQVKEYPFEVAVPIGLALSGVILADQVLSLDWEARSADYILTLPKPIVSEVIDKIHALLD
jgi:mRNA interferase MazF